jgi:hypothetical protein
MLEGQESREAQEAGKLGRKKTCRLGVQEAKKPEEASFMAFWHPRLQAFQPLLFYASQPSSFQAF